MTTTSKGTTPGDCYVGNKSHDAHDLLAPDTRCPHCTFVAPPTADKTTAAVAALDALTRGDNAAEHAKADAILLQYLRTYGFNEIADAYERARSRLVFWYA